MEIYPTILTSDIKEATSQMQLLERLKIAGHLDVIDGEFAEMKTVTPEILAGLDEEHDWEIHLMVSEPIEWVERCLLAGAVRIYGQIEMMSNQVEFIDTVQRASVEAGLGIDLDTNLAAVESDSWMWIERLLIMGVKAGASGQKFDEKIYKKIEEVINLRRNKGFSFRIEIDGGVSEEVYYKVREMNVEAVAMHSALWNGDLQKNWESLRK